MCICSYFSLFWLSALKNCVALCAGMCVCVRVQTRLDANHPWMKCILCLRAYYLDNNIHISSHLQSFITALWALSFTLSHYLSLPFSLAHTLIHTCTRTQQRAIMGLLPLVSFGKTVNNFFFHHKVCSLFTHMFLFPVCVSLCVHIYISIKLVLAYLSLDVWVVILSFFHLSGCEPICQCVNLVSFSS